MPLYAVKKAENSLGRIKPCTFVEVQMRERQDLQALLRDNSSAIGLDLLVFSEEFSTWQDSSRRVDLLALDRGASLVIIELKRVEEGSHMDLQSIRYAAMLSAMDFEAVVAAYENFLGGPETAVKHGVSPAEAQQTILDFLGAASADEVVISSTPRIVLMSPSFSKEITTTVLWLNDLGLDIRCLDMKPYKLDGETYLDIEQVIPLPSADAYIVKRRNKALKNNQVIDSTKRRQKSISLLVGKGILQPGTRLHLIKAPRPNLIIPDGARVAIFQNEQEVIWEHNGSKYSLSALCRVICKEFGGDVGSGAFAGPDYWAIEGSSVSLADRAKEPNPD